MSKATRVRTKHETRTSAYDEILRTRFRYQLLYVLLDYFFLFSFFFSFEHILFFVQTSILNSLITSLEMPLRSLEYTFGDYAICNKKKKKNKRFFHANKYGVELLHISL